MFGAKPKKPQITRVIFLIDVAGPTFVAHAGDVLDLPGDMAGGFIKSGAAVVTTREPRVAIDDRDGIGSKVSHDQRHSLRAAHENFVDMQRPEAQPE